MALLLSEDSAVFFQHAEGRGVRNEPRAGVTEGIDQCHPCARCARVNISLVFWVSLTYKRCDADPPDHRRRDAYVQATGGEDLVGC
jgi:hypothetical protein